MLLCVSYALTYAIEDLDQLAPVDRRADVRAAQRKIARAVDPECAKIVEQLIREHDGDVKAAATTVLTALQIFGRCTPSGMKKDDCVPLVNRYERAELTVLREEAHDNIAQSTNRGN